MIKVDHLRKSLGTQIILDDISFNIQAGEIVALMGPSGTGKTVLLKHMIGLMKPDSGRVIIDGVDITLMREPDLLKVRKEMGYLFQEGALYDFLNVFDNIAFPLREHTKLSAKDISARVRDVLAMVDLEGVEKKFPSQLSGGMKKRVGLARAIVLGAKIILCDEPTSGLDPILSRDISNLILNVSRKIHATTIMTSHDIENALRISDRVILLNEGKIVATGTREEMRANANPFVKEFVHT